LEPEGNNNQRVIGHRKKRAALCGFLAAAWLFMLIIFGTDDVCLYICLYVIVSLTLEQQELCRIRLKLLQFIDRLLTYQVCCIDFWCFVCKVWSY